MDDNIKIRLIEYWISDYSKLKRIPDDLKEKVSQEEITNLYLEIEPTMIENHPNVSTADIYKHLEKVRKKIKDELEIDFIKTQKEAMLKQIKIQDEQKELMQEQTGIQKKQVEIQEKLEKITSEQSKNSVNQTKILSSTFWIYSLTALVMFVQLVIGFVSGATNLRGIFVLLGSVVIGIFGTVFLIIWQKIQLPMEGTVSWFNRIALIFFIISLVIITLFMLNPSWAPKLSEEPSAKVNIQNMDQLIQSNENMLNKTIDKFTIANQISLSKALLSFERYCSSLNISCSK
jgi:hypothetical protein